MALFKSIALFLIFFLIGSLESSLANSDPNISVAFEARLAEARSILLAAKVADLDQDYRPRLEKAMVLYYQASLTQPDSPYVWLRLGRLAEIRALWAADLASREELLAEARGHFLKAARLGYEKNRPKAPAPKTSRGPADPFVAELYWTLRLKRGEIKTDELTRHYAYNDLNPLYQPGLWRDRRYLLLNDPDPLARERRLNEWLIEFDKIWAVMPSRVPNLRPDSPIIKKIDLLLAFSETLLSLVKPISSPKVETLAPPNTPSTLKDSEPKDQDVLTKPPDPPLKELSNGSSNKAPDLAPTSAPGAASTAAPGSAATSSTATVATLTSAPRAKAAGASDDIKILPTPGPSPFDLALNLWPRALSQPLDPSDLDRFLTLMDQAEELAPTLALKEALWALKDQFFNRQVKVKGAESLAQLAWGADYYRRASSLADDKRWAALNVEAAKKMTRAVATSQAVDRTRAEWGRVLESAAYAAGSKTDRYLKALTLARDQYQLAYDLGQKFELLNSLARVNALLAFAAQDLAEFTELFQKATNFGRLAVRVSDNPAAAWLAWAQNCLAFQRRELKADYRELVVAEIFAAYNHYLSSNPTSLPRLIETADGVWSIAAKYPQSQDQALSVLIDVCRRLNRLAPDEPGYGFALGLTLYAQLINRPDWPDDPTVASDLTAKRAFEEALTAFLDSLESLSLWRPTFDSPPPAGLAQTYEPLNFLAPEVGEAWVYAPSATFRERLASALNRPVSRFMAMVRPESLPPWYQLKLASFLRLAAASGYLPDEERIAYWRLSLRLLRLAKSQKTDPVYGLVLAEEGLVLAELNLLNVTPDPGLLQTAEALWREAEKVAPGSSYYAKARWAAWRGDENELKKSLSHPPTWEDNLTWPEFRQGVKDPAFRDYRDQSWLKAVWHGYAH
ncbi:MAG: hypothetical protein LBI10_08240 [Deltaproteobacteria bacterium]|jgi:hypothetical protein|nr:hypothetical protein [Deltaproteobacteria bacterium]